jgi:hypothetical protein
MVDFRGGPGRGVITWALGLSALGLLGTRALGHSGSGALGLNWASNL